MYWTKNSQTEVNPTNNVNNKHHIATRKITRTGAELSITNLFLSLGRASGKTLRLSANNAEEKGQRNKDQLVHADTQLRRQKRAESTLEGRPSLLFRTGSPHLLAGDRASNQLLGRFPVDLIPWTCQNLSSTIHF